MKIVIASEDADALCSQPLHSMLFKHTHIHTIVIIVLTQQCADAALTQCGKKK